MLTMGCVEPATAALNFRKKKENNYGENRKSYQRLYGITTRAL